MSATRAKPISRDEVPADSAGDEAALVAQAQSDRRAFAPLYHRYVADVYRYCYRRLGSRAAAEDATSLVFTRALAALPSYRAGSFRGWLFTIAHHATTDMPRAKAGNVAGRRRGSARVCPDTRGRGADNGGWGSDARRPRTALTRAAGGR